MTGLMIRSVSAAAIAAAGMLLGGFTASAATHDCSPGLECDPGETAEPADLPPGPTVALSTRFLSFGTALTVSGRVPGARAGRPVELLSQPCGFDQPTSVRTLHTQQNGRYAFAFTPMQNAVIYVRSGRAVAKPTQVFVRPLLQLRRTGSSDFRVDVSVANGASLMSTVLLQRYDFAHRTWRTVGQGTLKLSSPADAIVAVSTATIHAHLPRGAKLRASVTQGAVGSCYRPASSPAITS
jgi:hypothetical protein